MPLGPCINGRHFLNSIAGGAMAPLRAGWVGGGWEETPGPFSRGRHRIVGAPTLLVQRRARGE